MVRPCVACRYMLKWSLMWIQYQRSVLHNFFLRCMRPGRVFTILVCLEINKGDQRWREELLLWSSTRPTFSPCPSISEKCRYPWKRFSIFFKKRRHGTLCQLDLCVCLFFRIGFFPFFSWTVAFFLLRVVSRSRSDFVFFGWVPVRVRRKRKFAWNISFSQVHKYTTRYISTEQEGGRGQRRVRILVPDLSFFLFTSSLL